MDLTFTGFLYLYKRVPLILTSKRLKMKRIFLFLTSTFIYLFSYGRAICDTACHAPEDEFRNYAVVSPVGRSMVTHIEQAPRLTTLDNKTIAIAAEYLGIPAVVVAGPGFTDQAKYTAYNNGVAVLRTAEYPGAFATHTEHKKIAIYDASGRMVGRSNPFQYAFPSVRRLYGLCCRLQRRCLQSS